MPASPNQVVEALKLSKGKPFADNPKNVPDFVKAVANKTIVKEDGFEGGKFENKKTGKAKQSYVDGSFFDGFMFEDNLVRGRFYFANGDFFQGFFVDN